MKQHSISGILTAAALFAATAALLLCPKEVSQAVRDGLTLCTDILLPSLFPFFILSSFLVRSGLARKVGSLLDPIMQPLFHLPGCCSSALVLGLIGGYPTGAKTAAELYRSGLCSRQEAQRMLGFCNNCGPAFLLGTAGYGLFGDLRYGVLLLLVHSSAAVLTGLLWNSPSRPIHSTTRRDTSTGQNTSLPAAFADSVTGSFRAMLDLFAFVLCFSAITRLAQLSGLPTAAGKLIFPCLTGENGEILLLGLLEMTCGVTRLTAGPPAERLILAAALLGWGGLSVHCQVIALLQDTDLSLVAYWKGKLLHALISSLLMAAILFNLNRFLLLTALITLPGLRQTPKKSSGKSAASVL